MVLETPAQRDETIKRYGERITDTYLHSMLAMAKNGKVCMIDAEKEPMNVLDNMKFQPWSLVIFISGPILASMFKKSLWVIKDSMQYDRGRCRGGIVLLSIVNNRRSSMSF